MWKWIAQPVISFQATTAFPISILLSRPCLSFYSRGFFGALDRWQIPFAADELEQQQNTHRRRLFAQFQWKWHNFALNNFFDWCRLSHANLSLILLPPVTYHLQLVRSFTDIVCPFSHCGDFLPEWRGQTRNFVDFATKNSLALSISVSASTSEPYQFVFAVAFYVICSFFSFVSFSFFHFSSVSFSFVHFSSVFFSFCQSKCDLVQCEVHTMWTIGFKQQKIQIPNKKPLNMQSENERNSKKKRANVARKHRKNPPLFVVFILFAAEQVLAISKWIMNHFVLLSENWWCAIFDKLWQSNKIAS